MGLRGVVEKTTGIVEKNMTKYPNKIPGKHNVYNLLRSAVLGTAHISIRKVLSIKPEKQKHPDPYPSKVTKYLNKIPGNTMSTTSRDHQY